MPIELTLHGAAGGVTGSCVEVRTPRSHLLVDCGLFQGGPSTEARNRRRLPVDPADLDAILITHAHVDHVGRLPTLDLERLRGPILATDATIDLAAIILRDAAHLQEQDARRLARRRRRRGRPGGPGRHGRGAVAPLYGAEDVDPVLRRFEAVAYDEPVRVAEDVSATWIDAGHILGSASIRLDVAVGPVGGATASHRTIVISGDVGARDTPLLRDPATFGHADLVLLESTYGDRDHRPREQTQAELRGLLAAAIHAREKILVPAFAVGRTQLLLHELRRLFADGVAPPVPVYVDSPMAIDATAIHRRHPECFDEAARAALASGDGPMSFPGLHMLREASESRALNDSWDPAVIIAGSGMCTGGRILHHLKHHLWRRNAAVVFVGYQAEGTLGRTLVSGARSVRILGEPVAVRASVHTVGGLSAHAGRGELLDWASAIRTGDRRFVVVHGEPEAAASLASGLEERGLEARPGTFLETIRID